MTIGVNWHNVIGTLPIPVGSMLSLPASQAGNIGWLGAGANIGGNSIAVGFNNNVTLPVNGTPSATDGWPLTAGQTIPFLTGEGEDVCKNIYAVATAVTQDLFVIGYAPDQNAAPTSSTMGFLMLTDGTLLVLTDGTNLLLVP